MTTATPIQEWLSVRDLEVWLAGRPLVGPVSFDVAAGELVVIRGPNGCGKTTLLRALFGELPHRGEIRLGLCEGRTPRLDLVPQSFPFDPSLPITVHDVLALGESQPVFLRRRPSVGHEQWLERVGCAALGGRMLGGLSGGELRRVLLARALTSEPDLLVLDEPASHLDIEGAERFDRLLLDLRRERGLAVLAVVHGEGELVRAADRIVDLPTASAVDHDAEGD